MHSGQQITGFLSCAPNVKNNRDLDIKIEYFVPEYQSTPAQSSSVEYKMCVIQPLAKQGVLPQGHR